jgi:hypothetical protein
MTPTALYTSAIVPALALLPPSMGSEEAQVVLLAIAGQESDWSQRLQQPVPWARSYWQMEKTGAVVEVLTNPATVSHLTAVCAALDVPVNLDTLYEAIAWHDVLATALARLALWASPLDASSN